MSHRHPANQVRHDDRTLGQRVADDVVQKFGSWRYICTQTVLVIGWVLYNVWTFTRPHFDPYPFILLNLMFSTQASYAAPLILLSQNRASDTDRRRAEHDYAVNETALKYLAAIHAHLHGEACGCPATTDVDALLDSAARRAKEVDSA